MKRFSYAGALVAIVGLTLFSGVLQGTPRYRWGPSTALVRAAQKLAEMPADFGPWHLQDSRSLDQDALDQLECAGQFVRNYVNLRTGQAVAVTLIVGPTGPTAVHTPEICLPSRDYTIRGTRQLMSIPTSSGWEGKFWSTNFQSKGVQGQWLRVCYAWNAGDGWQAPEDARFALAGHPYLYKLQVMEIAAAPMGSDESDSGRAFLRDFLPVVQHYVTGPSRD